MSKAHNWKHVVVVVVVVVVVAAAAAAAAAADDDDDDDDDDGRFYIALFSAHEQTHCARMSFYVSK